MWGWGWGFGSGLGMCELMDGWRGETWLGLILVDKAWGREEGRRYDMMWCGDENEDKSKSKKRRISRTLSSGRAESLVVPSW